MNIVLYQNLFKVTAVINIIGGVAAVFGTPLYLELFYGVSESNRLLQFYHINFWIIVFAMGIGYWFLSLDPIRFRPIALLGAIGKLSASISWIIMIYLGEGSLLLLGGVIFDLFFGILMALFYFRSRESMV
ncbi:hypothetical protein LPTSP3_g22710 [Leptospira kobayashii]|uniref:Uncharacterized protein n=1 Tax=Leptospira kobayashii TaxID=1917830 RepID=A0ABM7UKG2_9LEPT|nr:hypothetical protein [Leptospira kobayashii]BDA79341.1 hypothetical protein LPTSP3_g22710 [Leptospira kobayashii]